jgi:hypothetical protein
MGLFGTRSISGEVRRRHITLLLHSTHLYKNLPQILKDGTLDTVRTIRLRYGNAAARFLHDPHRYEKFAVGLDYLNATLTVPNYELLYHRSKGDWKSEWVHLALDVSLLEQDDTRFSPVSAAADCGKNVKSGIEGFRSLFAETIEDVDRTNLPPHTPTHPQAEILLRGPLSLDPVRSIIVADPNVAVEVERLCEQYGRAIRVECLPHFFVWPERLIKR